MKVLLQLYRILIQHYGLVLQFKNFDCMYFIMLVSINIDYYCD